MVRGFWRGLAESKKRDTFQWSSKIYADESEDIGKPRLLDRVILAFLSHRNGNSSEVFQPFMGFWYHG